MAICPLRAVGHAGTRASIGQSSESGSPVRRRAAKAADNVGCPPPQPKILAGRGRRIPATSSFVRWPPASPRDSLVARLRGALAPVWSQYDGVHEAAHSLGCLGAAFGLLERLGELCDLRAVDAGHLRVQKRGRLVGRCQLRFERFPPHSLNASRADDPQPFARGLARRRSTRITLFSLEQVV